MTINANEPIILISSKRAAELIGVKPQTLRLWRYAGKGPRYIRLGENRYCQTAYRVTDIEAWMEEHTFTSTTHETVAKEERG